MALEQSEYWMEVADAIINKYAVAFSHIEIDKVLFLSETEKTPKKYGDTRKVGYPFNFLTEIKYIIVFYENNIQAMTDAQKHLLCMHELSHIDSDFEKIRRHDVEDFREILAIYGVNWDIDSNLKDILADDEEDDI